VVIASGQRLIIVSLASEEGSTRLVGANFGGSGRKWCVKSSCFFQGYHNQWVAVRHSDVEPSRNNDGCDTEVIFVGKESCGYWVMGKIQVMACGVKAW
jgi:hypothetical protein